ncbi:hypothetical protein MCOR02_012062 [Pyricularia oryzae]|nr:hypothetical protein MCOR02_012062 [Pyricularia oryzae]KAI6288926.1 hypothetical protein MCOR34_010793 [Pyricularia oryzae]KAI6479664.1 hypothetical protein MCOR13_011380 [Pyricularia oryzae]KAI6627966.1 hypothetical protein MCOR14_008589 [Pyricularia oryzae]
MTVTQVAASCTCNFWSIFGWLDTIDYGVVGAQPTPPLLSHGPDPDSDLRKNPSVLTKRKRAPGLDTEASLPAYAMPPSPWDLYRDGPVFDSNLTPRAIRDNDLPPSSSSANLNPSRAPFTFHEPAPLSSNSSASRASTSTTISRNQSQLQRSTNPAKRIINLMTLEKPIDIVPGNNSAKIMLELLPPDVHGLHKTLQSISGLVTPCIPGHVQKEVTGMEGPMLSAWFASPGESDNMATAIAELKTLDSICDDAFRLASQKEWNAWVYVELFAWLLLGFPAAVSASQAVG